MRKLHQMPVVGLRVSVILLALLIGDRSVVAAAESEKIHATHGVAVGDVSENSAVVWSRTDRAAVMNVLLVGEGSNRAIHRTAAVDAEHDFTGKIEVKDLKAETRYTYKVWFSETETATRMGRPKAEGEFRTAPLSIAEKSVAFAWGGDLGGQNVCRDVEEGFPIFGAIERFDLDFFIGLGDMIYADGTCEALGKFGNRQVPGDFDKSASMKDFWAHWKYNREDDGYRKILARMPYYAIWDDHEVVNDFGPYEDRRDVAPYNKDRHLMPLGRRAFLDYNPVRGIPHFPNRLHRTIRWGRHLEVFILDNRQYRDLKSGTDNPDRMKTMLGKPQREWLKESLKASDATWKFVVSSVPISIPTGWPPEDGRDGWANFDQDTGYENELLDILGFIRGKGVRNLIFITTDVHFAAAFRYTPFEEEADFQIYEFVSGPLSAGLYPNREYDTSLGTESLFFYGPETIDSVKTYEEAKKWMNFGAALINERGYLTVTFNNVQGSVLYHMKLAPE